MPSGYKGVLTLCAGNGKGLHGSCAVIGLLSDFSHHSLITWHTTWYLLRCSGCCQASLASCWQQLWGIGITVAACSASHTLGLPCTITKIIPEHWSPQQLCVAHRAHEYLHVPCSQVEAMADGKHWLRPSLCRVTPSYHFCATVAAIYVDMWGSSHPGVPSGTHVCSSVSLPFFLAWGLGLNWVPFLWSRKLPKPGLIPSEPSLSLSPIFFIVKPPVKLYVHISELCWLRNALRIWWGRWEST